MTYIRPPLDGLSARLMEAEVLADEGKPELRTDRKRPHHARSAQERCRQRQRIAPDGRYASLPVGGAMATVNPPKRSEACTFVLQ